jgi:hypothetical protein
VGYGAAIAQLCFFGAREIVDALGALFLFYVLRLFLRKDGIAAGAYIVIASMPNIAGAEPRWVIAPFPLLMVAIGILLLMRFGLLTVAVSLFVQTIFNYFPITLRLSAWYSSVAFPALFVVAVLTLFGFRTSMGGRPLVDIARVEG